jgi:hypothetical protein
MPPARRNSPKGSLADTAGDRVRAILEAAESSAAAIRAEAEAHAERIRVQAEEGASILRSEARGDVQALVGSIRETVDRLQADLERLERRLGDGEHQPASPASVQPALPGARGPVGVPADEDPDFALAEDAAVEPEEPAGRRADLEGARLVALNMALDGASREDVSRHLRDHHSLPDSAELLDEVYESIGRS